MRSYTDEMLEVARKFRAEFRKKAQEADYNYQTTGMTRYYTTYRKYDDLAYLMDKAIEELKGDQADNNKRVANYHHFINEGIPKHEKFTRDEVIELIEKTMIF